jgi:2-polyprenyl-3-methyl-5-hydroxy-6-metoxy-1,4-benzoquinol methylase
VGLDQLANYEDYEAKWQEVGIVLDRELRNGAARALDAGCGTGWFTRRVASLGFTQVEAVDFSANAAEIAKGNAPTVTVRVAALDEISGIGPYDVVLCVDVLFHVVDDDRWARTIANLASLTAPEGVLVIQDSLNESGESEPAAHVRFRSLAMYLRRLGAWKLENHRSYVLPNERIRKDLMVFRCPPSPARANPVGR